MRDEVLLLDNVTKTIKGRQIIKGISFSMKQGEVMGFLGPNGAGKSTTLRMIVGLSKPTSGKIDICRYSITKNYVKAMSNVGCIIEGPDLYNYISGIDNLKMLASMSRDVTEKDIINVVDLVGLKNRIKDKVSTYSLGMKQRLGIAQALMHNPKLLILDEPTNGLDPSGISELRNLVKLLASEKNISVLVSSHIISEIELMCDKVTIIKNGQTVLESADVDKLLSNQGVFWVLSDNEKGRKILEKNWKVKGNVVEERLEANVSLEKLQEINSCFVERGLMIKYVDNKNKTLEDLFLNLTEGNQII
ncbi:ABC transporter ATP-binding protein [Clostridium ljungdahlii]|uniref:ABC transporter ATP-binding protein YxlF n=1 Tax=Clostridium ljungdahlii (strain ATCC 55383 / DSM 13528 / PETC) TaxID=748727 RepID=D8GI35_CLOLD|nr:ABC transporter ATP-binding protein [Clostridium ljungdahlii]ADK14897.1 predicted ABC transporter, ATP-binding component [Clostridium ljungdahlii DSM 13528]OAA87892.1 putative ABC transporter ATP-binding protein YxlF [Clostridium ljungdahlii DSM 13528]